MDFVYTWKQGTGEELRYSIRSVVSSFPNANVWIIGDCPKWYIGDHVRFSETKSKFHNIANAAKKMIEIDSLSEDIIYMNDDFFIMNTIDSIPIFHGGKLRDKISNYIETRGRNSYLKALVDTESYLKSLGIEDPISYELHRPLPMKKSLLGPLSNSNMLPMSVYGNVNNIGGTYLEDVKNYGEKINSFGDFISTSDASFMSNRKLIQSRFPDKSRFEA